MGCCQDSKSSMLNQALFKEKVVQAIDSGSLKRLGLIMQILSKKNRSKPTFIDEEIITVKQFRLNALCYCVFNGNAKMFKVILDKGASLKSMDSLFYSQQLRAINIICFKGHLQLLKQYLPIYLKNYTSYPESNQSFTIDLNDTGMHNNNFELPIHSAIRGEMCHIVSYLYSYFDQSSHVPREFDIKAVDDYFGEDAGLMACRSGCFPLIKFLHEQCGVSFSSINKRKENALMICACGHKKGREFSYLECISYLVEIVKVDISYMHEEMLLSAEDPEIVNYIELQLAKVGINIKKCDIDNAPQRKETKEDFDNCRTLFTDAIREYMKSENSLLSSIQSEVRSRMNGSSFLDNFE